MHALAPQTTGERVRHRDIDLATMPLAECPDLWTAVEAGLMHGLAPKAALKAAFGKWMTDNADAVQTFRLANFYDGPHADRAFVDWTLMAMYLVISHAESDRTVRTQARILAHQGAQIAALTEELRAIRRLLPSLPPNEELAHAHV